MRIIHGQGYSNDERLKYRELVYKNVVKGIVTLIEAMGTLDIPYESEAAKQRAESLRELDPNTAVSITNNEQQAMAAIWADPGVQTCYQRRREFQISDSAK